jgi:hypothetical protein
VQVPLGNGSVEHAVARLSDRRVSYSTPKPFPAELCAWAVTNIFMLNTGVVASRGVADSPRVWWRRRVADADVCMMGPEYSFNSNDGYFEALARGWRAGILTPEDYTNLCQCENLEGLSYFRVIDPRPSPPPSPSRRPRLHRPHHFYQLPLESHQFAASPASRQYRWLRQQLAAILLQGNWSERYVDWRCFMYAPSLLL